MCTIAITKIITRRELTSWKRELQEVMTDRRGRVSVDFREEGEEKERKLSKVRSNMK